MIREDKNQEQGIAHIIMAQDLQLSENDAFSVKAESLSTCIRKQLQNGRQGTVACKNRAAVVSRSNKKPWKQKGTGRARAGSPRSPLWRGGGVVFGPQPRVRQLKVSKSLNRKVMGSLFWEKINNKQIIALEDLPSNIGKTAHAYQLLSQAQLLDKKIALFVSRYDYKNHNAFANLGDSVRMYLFDQPNVYALADANFWVFFKKDIEQFKAMVNVWI